jgi:hypothetical protein
MIAYANVGISEVCRGATLGPSLVPSGIIASRGDGSPFTGTVSVASVLSE